MQRTIGISTGVFAAIWANRQDGEESEDAILQRILRVKRVEEPNAPAPISGSGGVIDQRSGVRFPEGFRIFRRYKGTEYIATASNGHWRREDNGLSYPTINQLNASIVSGSENVWNGNWKFNDIGGVATSIAKLRGRSQ